MTTDLIKVVRLIVSLLTNKMSPADKKCELIKNIIQKYGKLKYIRKNTRTISLINHLLQDDYCLGSKTIFSQIDPMLDCSIPP